jgi:hypothetical protein
MEVQTMRIERDTYVAVIEAVRVTNRHERVRFHYTITRRSPSPVLLVSGSAATEGEASTLLKQYLEKFAAMQSKLETDRQASAAAAR